MFIRRGIYEFRRGGRVALKGWDGIWEILWG